MKEEEITILRSIPIGESLNSWASRQFNKFQVFLRFISGLDEVFLVLVRLCKFIELRLGSWQEQILKKCLKKLQEFIKILNLKPKEGPI